MRAVKSTILMCLALLSVAYLCLYGRAVLGPSVTNGYVDWSLFNEVSVWLYRERDQAGRPASLYRIAPYLSTIDPYDGPNWEIRVPGWIPALGAIGALTFVALSCSGKKERDPV